MAIRNGDSADSLLSRARHVSITHFGKTRGRFDDHADKECERPVPSVSGEVKFVMIFRVGPIASLVLILTFPARGQVPGPQIPRSPAPIDFERSPSSQGTGPGRASPGAGFPKAPGDPGSGVGTGGQTTLPGEPASPFGAGNGAGVGTADAGGAAEAGGFASALGGSGGSSGAPPGIIGDQSPIVVSSQATTIPPLPRPITPTPAPTTPSPRLASALSPGVRGIKIAENQSPRPQDRVFYSFNFYGDLNRAVNARFDTPVKNLRAYRHILGFEKTFDDGRGSIGFRLPIDTLTADSNIAGNFAKPGGTSTSPGDLGLFAKFIFRDNPKTGSLISAGVALTAPTGPRNFAGANYLQSIHTTRVQPFVGYIYNWDRLYLHGFTAVEFPMNPGDVTLAYNDVGIGYFAYRDDDPTHWLTAVAPTFEVHVNSALNHRGAFSTTDPSGTSSVVNLTSGLNLEFFRQSTLTFAVVAPVTTPKPFDLEAVALVNIRFGARRKAREAPPVVIGG